MTLDFMEVSPTFERVWLRLVAEAEERVYGGGEQFSYFNLRGKSYPIWTREQGMLVLFQFVLTSCPVLIYCVALS